ncbi:MAG: hypothetical protein HZA77_15160 [Candidatus Schekmanbacteria bacterium]|nr:hypothetical protein [Candidatus Schekmanbacteria bacterium]
MKMINGKIAFFFIILPIMFSSCIPAGDIEQRLNEIEGRVKKLEDYKSKEGKQIEDNVKKMSGELSEAKRNIDELMRRTSLVGESIQEEKLEDNR